MSLRFQKQIRAQQRQWRGQIEGCEVGPARIGLLIRFAAEKFRYNGRAKPFEQTPHTLRRRRVAHNGQRDSWLGSAGHGMCRACGRWRDRIWHHIMPLMNGGSNNRHNRLRICEECHAQIHPHLDVPGRTNEQLYHEARRTLQPDLRPRLVKKAATA